LINHRILYPREDFKDQWTHFPTGAKGWERTKRLGLLYPTAPNAEQLENGVENSAEGKNEYLKVDIYSPLPGETILSVTLYAYCSVGTGGEVSLHAWISEGGEFAPLKVGPSVAAWHSITHVGAISATMLENLQLRLSQNKGSSAASKLYFWYLDLETETTFAVTPPTDVGFAPAGRSLGVTAQQRALGVTAQSRGVAITAQQRLVQLTAQQREAKVANYKTDVKFAPVSRLLSLSGG
jgi:hypothetical protein